MLPCQHSPLQVFKYCPQCGHKDLKADSEKSMRCNACGFRYFINMSASVAAIIRNDRGEVLFTVRKHEPSAGSLDLPGGFVDLGETAEQAVVREIAEELNLTITHLDYLATFTNKYLYSGIEYETLDLVFNCSVETFTGIQVADDVTGFVFRDVRDVHPDEIGLDSIKRIVKQIKGFD